MRKITLFIAFLLIQTAVFSQVKGTSDISFGIGVGSSNDVFDMSESIINGADFQGSKSSPVYNLTYKYAIKDKWFIYADGSFQNIKEDLVKDGENLGEVKHKYFTVGVGSEYHYIVKEWFQMYSGGSVAITKQKSDGSSNIGDIDANYFNFQVNAIGLRFGKKALAGFLELGVGYKGFATVGGSYQF